MPRTKPDLLFGPGSNSGFTPAGIAAFDDLRPAAVVRELIQNSLDAARLAKVKPTAVCFRLSRVDRESIPGMQSYKEALGLAVQSQKDMNDGEIAPQAELVLHRIAGALLEDQVDVLSVTDNGIGLNEKRMNALLSDGLSVKGEGATGTYGNGHSTAIPASDLRYILYGGLTADGDRIASGHAVLASHFVDGEHHPRSGDGFYIVDFRTGKGTLYKYASDSKAPKLIANELDRIQNVHKHGTVVIIPAFNHFLEEESDLWDMVSHAASANFFVAIEEGELEVRVEDFRSNGEPKCRSLNKKSLARVLEEHSDKRRSASFLSGLKAFEAHKTFRRGSRHELPTSVGKIKIHLAENPSGTTRIDLCRNGMWITDRIPLFQGKFADRIPFHAVLSLKAKDGDELHDFVKKAEGPLHDSLAIKRLPENERGSFRSAIREIIDWLLEHTTVIDSEAYTSDEFLTLDFGSDSSNGGGGNRNSIWGTPIVVGRRPSQQFHSSPDESEEDDDDSTNNGKKRKKPPVHKTNKSRRRPSLQNLFQATSRPAGDARRRFQIEFPKGCQDAQMRLLVDESLDATCERHGQDQYTPVVLDNVMIDGRLASAANLEFWDKQVIGVRFGDMEEGSTVVVETDFRVVGDFSGLPNPSLRIEVFRTIQDEQLEPIPEASGKVGPL